MLGVGRPWISIKQDFDKGGKSESRKARKQESRTSRWFAFGLVRHALRSADTAPTGCRGGTAQTSLWSCAESCAGESESRKARMREGKKAGKQERLIPLRPGCPGDGPHLGWGRAERRAGEPESEKAGKQESWKAGKTDTPSTGMPRGRPRPRLGPRRASCWRARRQESKNARERESKKAGKTDTPSTGMPRGRPRPRVGAALSAGPGESESKKAGKLESGKDGYRFDRDAPGTAQTSCRAALSAGLESQKARRPESGKARKQERRILPRPGCSRGRPRPRLGSR